MRNDNAGLNYAAAVLDRESHDSRRGVSVITAEMAILARAPYPNGLFVGVHAARALAALLPHVSRVVTEWDPRTCAELPRVANGTLVIWHVDLLDAHAQRRLHDFLDPSNQAGQMISVAASDPFERLQRGEFLDSLYYRLNVVRIDASH